MSVGIPSVPQTDSGMYQFLLALKQNVEALQNGTAASSGTTGTGSSTAAAAAEGVALIVSNPVIVLPAYSNGTVESFGTANGQATMTNNGVNVTASAIFSLVASGATATINTSQGVPVAGQPIGYYQITAMTGTTAQLTVTGTVDGVTLTALVNATQAQSGIEIVNSLPTTGLYQGRVVFLTTDNKLYRYDGTEWITAVSATDVTGQIDAAQIQDGIITTAKLLPGLEPVQLVTVLPPYGIAGRVVYLTTDQQLYRDTGTSWTAEVPTTGLTGQIQTGQIAALAITSAQIAANSITAGQIQAGAVTTNAMLANSITGDRIQAGTLAATAIYSNSITALQMAANSISALALQANAVTANSMLAGTITAAQIATNTITAAQMAISTLSAISANLGTITAGTIVFNAGGYMRVMGLGFGAAGNLLEWFGPSLASISLCTKANAIDYLGTDGTAYFGGNILITTGSNAYGAWIQFPPNPAGTAFLEQFGTTAQTSVDPGIITYPLKFPNVCMSVTANPIHAGGGGIPATTLNGLPGLSTCSFYSGGFGCTWRAIGY